MLVSNNISLKSYAQLSYQKDLKTKPALNNTSQVALETKTIPAFAWKANTIPFCSIKMPVEDFKDKMQKKIDKIKEGTYEKSKTDKAAQVVMKTEAIAKLKGPLVLKCENIKDSTLEELNKEFANIKDNLSLYNLIDDPRIPEEASLTITELPSNNYKDILEVALAASHIDDVKKSTAMVEEALQKMEGEEIIIPDFAINASRKELVKSIISHVNDGYEFEPESIFK